MKYFQPTQHTLDQETTKEDPFYNDDLEEGQTMSPVYSLSPEKEQDGNFF